MLPGKITEEQERKQKVHHIVQQDMLLLSLQWLQGQKQVLDTLEEALTRLTDALEMEGVVEKIN